MEINLKENLEDYIRFILGYDVPCEHNHLLLACMPKSGSTWLSTMLSSLPGFEAVTLVNGWDRREQELSEIQLLLHHHSNYVSQMHIRYSEPTAALMHRFTLKPIVLVRNIFDIVPSIRDHWNHEGVRGPACYLSTNLTDWPPDKIDEFIVDMGLPWYFNFSWRECEDKLLLTYEELRLDPRQAMARICDHYAIGVTATQIDDAISKAKRKSTRLNKAEVGRQESISNAARKTIVTMASYYEEVDFTPIGIQLETDRG
jgi:hypothetical protein